MSPCRERVGGTSTIKDGSATLLVRRQRTACRPSSSLPAMLAQRHSAVRGAGLKYVFPTSPTHLWYQSYKIPSCGLLDDCAYNLSSIQSLASRVAALIEHEMHLVGGNNKNVFLGGATSGGLSTPK
eukprot:SAG31_NODE_3037_length_4761_cov_2.884384_6_plen_126_part_00